MKTIIYIKKITEIFLMFIIFFLPLIFCGMAMDPFWVTEKFIFKFTISILIIFFSIYFLLIKNIPVIKTPLNLIFIFFIIVNIAGIFKILSLYYFLDKFIINIYYIIFFFMVVFFIEQYEINKNKILIIMIISVTFMVIYGIIQVAGFDIISWKSNFAGRAASTLGNPNFLAGHILFFLPLIYIYLFIQNNLKSFFLTLILVLLLTYGLLITQTRGAYLAFFVSFIFMVILMLIYKRDIFIKYKKGLVILLLIIIILPASYLIFNKNAFNRVKDIIFLKDEAANIRLSLWKNSLNVVKNNIFLGTGTGNFSLKYSYYQASSLSPEFFKKSDFYRSAHSHNDYIQFAAEYGLAGLGVMLFLVFILFKTGFSFLKISSQNADVIIIGILSGILGILIHAFFNFPFLIIPTATYFYCFSAILIYSCKKSSVELIPVSNKIILLIILSIILSFTIIVFSSKTFISNIYLRYAKENEFFNKIKDAVYYAEKAVNIDKNYEENYVTLASLYEKTGDNNKSCICFKKIYELNPGYWEANLNLFDCYASEENKEKMLEIGKNLYNLSPYSKKAIRSFALGLYINGKYNDAIKIFDEGINLYKDDYEIYTYLAICYAANGELEKAIQNFKKAIEINPDFKDAYFNMAVAYYSFKKFKEAKEVINKMKRSGFFDEKIKNLLKAIENEK